MPLPLNDPKWSTLFGGYRTLYNPSNVLKALQENRNFEDVYSELWEELHHQGDVDDASYSTVPYLIEAIERQPTVDWNPYALVAAIEMARLNDNPPVPDWLLNEYLSSIKVLGDLAVRDLSRTNDPLTIRCLLGAVALGKGVRKIGILLSNFDESEYDEVIKNYLGEDYK